MTETTTQRDAIMFAMAGHVLFDGWSDLAFRAALDELGLSLGEGLRIYPKGPIDVLSRLADWADERMAEGMAKRDLERMRVRDKVAAGVRLRLEALAPYREAVRRGSLVLALPQNAALSCRHTYKTVDAIWRAAGDTSVDFNFYTKRGLLAAVYVPCVLYWLADESEDFADTWDFLNRRIADVLKIPGLKGKLERRLKSAPSPLRLLKNFTARSGRRYC
ncbi:COQ9 family protein [Varunaivibrio sulfuroxidans]|uniref:Ubiquinone biosynthesis protein COQ9 n=1 Tax=Varunaivibrio sulfuroxidans TaxID=1773489 RepID=A0A4R3JB05_9PROT|nr:COQ9 family protein [Varunaivibrio sulfuroxidans]TCS63068.1 ubiquinone biosynthesis protein COQ9 [Varunaivibrio sulfuroxidans]WES31860.1 COQ9 family protein [Varunaivibrio sulfuroxidans]